MTLPHLPEPYQTALRICCESLFTRYDVVGILASGTVLRGVGDPRSDLDIHVLHIGTFRERLQEWVNGVPCEIFVNPPWRIEQYFTEDAADRRPMTAHMFATGVATFDPQGLIADLQEKAKLSLESPPPSNPQNLIQERYHAATMLEDALDLASRDPEGAALLLGAAVMRLAECRVAVEPGWLPRAKDLFPALRKVDPESSDLAITATGGGSVQERLEAGRLLSIRVTGAEGFFEWKSDRQELESPETTS